MVKANELRIGNWLHEKWEKETVLGGEVYALSEDAYVKVESISYDHLLKDMLPDSYSVNNSDLSFFQPIPLSPDILISAGLVESKTMRGYIKSYNRKDEEDGEGKIVISHSIDFNCYMVSVGRNESIVNLNQIFYLHQLQNLYFALTGKELTINL